MIEVNWHPDDKQLRQFAVISLFGFALAGVVVWRASSSMYAAAGLGIVGAVTFLVGLVRPKAVRPVYITVTGLTLPIGWLISQIVLRLIFYCVLTPFGLFFRLIRRDPLKLRRPPSAQTYWQEHVERTESKSYFRQY